MSVAGVRRILVLKPSSLGDILHLFPALELLHRACPEAELDFFVRPVFAGILDFSPFPIRRKILFEREKLGRIRTFLPEFLKLLRELRRERYDLIIDFQGLLRSAIFAGLAKGNVAGFSRPRERSAALFYRQRIAVPEGHAVERYVALVNSITGKNEPVPALGLPENPAALAELHRSFGALPEPLISLVPGARWKSKQFPPEFFAAVAARVAAGRPEVTFAVIGGKGDLPLQEQLLTALPTEVKRIPAVGRTSLPAMLELLRHSSLTLSNDSGPVHAAAAAGSTVFALFSSTLPERTGPYGKQHRIFRRTLECSGCLKRLCPKKGEAFQACFRLEPESLAEEIIKFLESSAIGEKKK